MTVDGLQYTEQNSGGYTVQYAVINSNYSVWTQDGVLYYLYDNAANDVTPVSKVQLQSWMDAGYFDDSGENSNITNSNITPGNNPPVNTGAASWIKPAFIIGSVIMALYIFTR